MWIYWLWSRWPFKKRWKWLFPLVISDLPMFLLMIPHVWQYRQGIQAYHPSRLLAFFFVALWTYLGPLMILWWQEAIETLAGDLDRIPGSGGMAHGALKESPWWFFFISILWTLCPLGILLSRRGQYLLESFYFYGTGDCHYWLFLLCVGDVAAQTAVCYQFLFSSWRLVQAVSQNKAVMRFLLSNEGGRLNLSSIGSLAAKSAIYTSSGFLFFPILLEFFFGQSGADGREWIRLDASMLVFVLMGTFLIIILVYLHSTNRLVNQRAQLVKDEMLLELETKRERYRRNRRRNRRRVGQLLNCWMEEQALDAQIRRLETADVNPIGADRQMQLFSGIILSAVLPSLISALLGKL